MNGILLHACCAPCSIGAGEVLGQEAYTLFWDNPNIHPRKEYQLRKNALIAYAKEQNIPLMIHGEYGLKKFLTGLNGAWDRPGRCTFCYKTRLEPAAEYAQKNGFAGFSTTLLISPYQNRRAIAGKVSGAVPIQGFSSGISQRSE